MIPPPILSPAAGAGPGRRRTGFRNQPHGRRIPVSPASASGGRPL